MSWIAIPEGALCLVRYNNTQTLREVFINKVTDGGHVNIAWDPSLETSYGGYYYIGKYKTWEKSEDIYIAEILVTKEEVDRRALEWAKVYTDTSDF